jgi:hypothetical protein
MIATLLAAQLVFGFFPSPSTLLDDHTAAFRSGSWRPVAITLRHPDGSERRIDGRSEGGFGAWFAMLNGGKAADLATACQVQFTGTVTPQVSRWRVGLLLGESGWSIDQDSGLPIQLVCATEKLSFEGYGRGALPAAYPAFVEQHLAGATTRWQVLRVSLR